MTKNFIKSFSVYGLLGKDDVHIPLDKNIKILIGENGIGKTHILNILYYTLTGKFHRIIDFPFDKIELETNSTKVNISKKYIKESLGWFDNHPVIERVIDKIGFAAFRKFRNNIINFNTHNILETLEILENNSYFKEYKQIVDVAPMEYIVSILLEEKTKKSSLEQNKKDENNIFKTFVKTIEDTTSNNTILYFPTFRRVEEDLHNLGYDQEKILSGKEDTTLIHFGMDDVQQRFYLIEKRIDLLLKEGFTKMSSEILSKLVKGFGDTNQKILDRISETDIDIILARVGDQISDIDKSRIRGIILKKETSDTDNSLFYFIQTLVDIYEQQKEFDNSINKFKEVCNDYLIGKKVFYDESNIKIYIKSDNNSEPLPLNKLSSGEKQIISIFSKIYLSESNRRFIILFDEPELSLSMPWQKKLLPDILASNKCDFLLAVTHSPFIFDNDLDKYAIGLNEYIQPQEEVIA